MLKSNFGNREKLVPTLKPTQMFGLKFGMQGLSLGTALNIDVYIYEHIYCWSMVLQKWNGGVSEKEQIWIFTVILS